MAQENPAANNSDNGCPEFGDMPAEDFRLYGHRVIDWIADYLDSTGNYPVLSQARPGDIKGALPQSPPATGESMEAILSDFDKIILPGVTHWNHPAFFAYFSITGSMPGIIGEIFSAALNVNAMLWRTSPSATELEELTLDWLRQMIGLPKEFEGVIYDTASIATMCAIAAAREAVPGLRVREYGLMPEPGARWQQQRLRVYTSEQSHSSIEKAAITLGIGLGGVRKIETDSEFRMDAGALARAIEEDREDGYNPFCAVATVGTTSTTSIDPVAEIAGVCEREKIWLHVDAAYGGAAALVPEMRWVLDGCDRADSLVINPHKWLFVPFDLSALYCRRMGVLRQAFSLVPEYLRTSEPADVTNFMDYGPQLGRRFRALKLWFVIRYFGAQGLASRLKQHIELAREFASWVDKSADFERLAPVPLSVVCFRARPALNKDAAGGMLSDEDAYLNLLNEQLLAEVNKRGKVFLSHTKLNDKFTLRLAVGNIRTTREHIMLAWEELNSALAGIKSLEDTRR